ncbi:penicillin-binding protein [Halalkalibacter wakoensis JCM 9140]|uniref:Penicillin-binding protein n=1 Tax=Halalkalibacter wakoensis JCM 9140 TaxID=1236970 RepID=W4Q0Y9_9BACI|nr:transglycosylase domain-containing protein [Halalkalibacter wakoensis]GAE25746.1 penicillin-binding protein [Halalkalibacter wakoensis JCM 9140]
MMAKSITGWGLICLIFVAFIFLLLEVTTEVKEVKSLSEVISEQVDLEEINLSKNSMIYDRNGDVISEVFRDENRIYLPYEEIPSVVIDAFISTEDQRFFEHKGYDAIGIARAIMANARMMGLKKALVQ